MRGGPPTAELMRLAAESLAGAVLPALSGEARYAALMVASALGMAERELAHVDRPFAVPRLASVVAQASPNMPFGLLALGGIALEREACGQIRSGAFDGPCLAGRLFEALRRENAEALADVDPKHVAASDAAGARP